MKRYKISLWHFDLEISSISSRYISVCVCVQQREYIRLLSSDSFFQKPRLALCKYSTIKNREATRGHATSAVGSLDGEM